jgi:putative CocE/NonD family hydrolase
MVSKNGKGDATNMPIDFHMAVPMRDGIILSAAVCRPDGDGPFPVVLTRTCYTKWMVPIAERTRPWTAHGYALVIQDVRGRGDSDGTFYPLIHERADGIATLDWLAEQPWCDGRVIMIGGSYGGWTQLYLASHNHPALVAIAPAVTPPDPDRSFPQQFGLISPAAAAWMASLDGRTNQDLDAADVAGAFRVLPAIDFDRHIGRDLKPWRDWVENPPGNAYWRQQSYQHDLAQSRVPMLHISGWYDDCLAGAIQNFAGMTTQVQDPSVRAAQRLVIGPWMHGPLGQRVVGGIDFGPAAEIDMPGLQRAWFDAHLRGEPDHTPPVRLFVMGRNAWIDEQEWPLRRTGYTAWYLHSDGGANGRLGDGTLSLELPEQEPPDHYVYDPADPVPYATTFDWKQVGGPDDFAEIELREDVLVYTGPVLTEPLLICGPLQVRLFAASSARDTDWTAKILDVHPDGRAIRLNDGGVRARYRHGVDREVLLMADAVEEYCIDCCATCVELGVGHRLRIEIASSALGKFDINLNGGGAIGRETIPQIARQAVYHDRRYPSHVLLPVVRA